MKRRLQHHVQLGFEVGTGKPVPIPITHMCVTGMTQQAGKTTALEGLIARANMRAITFITKRGEAAFGNGARIAPYFHVEKFDWQYVESLIAARLGETNRLLRSFLMKTCAGASSLAEVQRNVKAARASARGFPESIYTEIDGYLDLVVPALASLPTVNQLRLQPGLNVMNLELYRYELQALVIRSVMERIAEHETDVITVLPEAWEFLPEGAGSPVKDAAETLIRKGATLGDFMWVDSQDLAGVWKLAVRQSPVILIGVQREANEIKRTLANIPAGVAKPKAADVAKLELGQFFACWGQHVVKVYAQPAWMDVGPAIAIAKGKVDVHELGAAHRPAPARSRVQVGDVHVHVVGDRDLVEHVERFVRGGQAAQRAVDQVITQHTKGDDNVMNAGQEKKLDEVLTGIGRLVSAVEDLVAHDLKRSPSSPAGLPPASTGKGAIVADRPLPAVAGVRSAEGTWMEFDEVYEQIKARLIDELPRDPRVMEIAVSQPELRVKVKRDTVTVDGESLQGRIARLMLDEFFNTHTTAYKAWQELGARGWKHDRRTVERAVADFAARGFLRREGREGYIIVGGALRRVVEDES